MLILRSDGFATPSGVVLDRNIGAINIALLTERQRSVMPKEFHYRWEFDLESSPEQLWPLVSDTNRFNRDTGVPSVEILNPQAGANARRTLRLSAFSLPVEWEEQPFEWVRPHRFGVVRRYSKGPVSELRVRVELVPQANAYEPARGTKLIYEAWATPKNLIGAIAIPLQIGFISARNFRRVIRHYDELAKQVRTIATENGDVDFAPGGRERLLSLSQKAVAQGSNSEIVALLVDYLENADKLSISRIRAYELARLWNQQRRAVLETFLCATRAGILDLQWSLMCPLCRGGSSTESLKEVSSQVHCPGCNIDFEANFDQSVELTFTPNPSIRESDVEIFCIGGPQVMPHVMAQQLLPAGESRSIDLSLDPGRYRLRTMILPGWQHLRVTDDAESSQSLRATADGWSNEEIPIAPEGEIVFENATGDEQLFILERTAWTDDAATAAEVTALQVFRDLFATEALRAGEQISVGTLTVLFTDLKNSTRLYREIGDATAFGRVMNHFDVLKQVIAEEQGAMVKTIGDAVMAVFRQPASALRAMLHAQQRLASPPDGMEPLQLKAGLHIGPCIAVTLNDRLDYFGSTVNLAARLEGQSTGDDVIISSAIYNDPAVRDFLNDPSHGLTATTFEIPLKGFDEEKFNLWRVARQNRS
ncbi:MAG TPA: adenylate/guanylate cyclase domain-containing protein [Pyrinomonadaceae bacterium]|nr:adenylate/guanylate cyclase domain-containing protein [Pyrinomonadaceae bacterium]